MTVEAASFVTVHEARIDRDPSRMVTRLVLPREDELGGYLRAQQLVDRIAAIPTHDVAEVVRTYLERFSQAHEDFPAEVRRNASVVATLVSGHATLDESHQLLIGMAFTSEFAAEAVAVCNPSAVIHPDQSGLEPGAIRVAVGLRTIGEGHISSIGFSEAIVTKDSWTFLPRTFPPVLADISDAVSPTSSETSARLDYDRQIEMAATVVGLQPTYDHVPGQGARERVRDRRHHDSTTHQPIHRRASDTARLYDAAFSASSTLSQRVLLPEVFDEAHGIEDARFVATVSPDGTTEYRACYVAFDGRVAVPRLMISPDLRSFDVFQMTGPATADKGLALFPRKVNGEYLALTRSGWQDISLARSIDGLDWRATDIIYSPTAIWEILKAGNCGSPIELDQGWLVITHGVGPVRSYSISAILLDKDDPSIVIARLTRPLIFTSGTNVDSYVPNVVYSCGSIVHEGTLWLPFSEGDSCVRVASITVADLLAAMHA